jgi:hypothetical protein
MISIKRTLECSRIQSTQVYSEQTIEVNEEFMETEEYNMGDAIYDSSQDKDVKKRTIRFQQKIDGENKSPRLTTGG